MSASPSSAPPRFGEPAPWFSLPCDQIPHFALDSVAGRWVVLMFFGSLALKPAQAALERIAADRALFDDEAALFFGVSVDPQDRARGLAPSLPGLRFFDDHERAASRLYGAAIGPESYRPMVFLLDPLLRVAASGPLEAVGAVLDALRGRLEPAPAIGEESRHPPVLTLPRVFEPEFCRTLVAHYEAVGGAPSGFMRQRGERTIGVHDATFKRRADVEVHDEALRTAVQARLRTRLVPMIERAFGWRATRLERYLVACYDEADAGFFRAHRDNTTLGTAHRRLAVTVNLNAGYEGGELSFPEFGPARFKPPLGGAVVFGCGLLHEVRPMTAGRRYAFLPFLYDDEAAALRERNAASLAPAPG